MVSLLAWQPEVGWSENTAQSVLVSLLLLDEQAIGQTKIQQFLVLFLWIKMCYFTTKAEPPRRLLPQTTNQKGRLHINCCNKMMDRKQPKEGRVCFAWWLEEVVYQAGERW